ncbi:MAG: DUF1353 domain-containing protein [Pseudomonadota bacterium]
MNEGELEVFGAGTDFEVRLRLPHIVFKSISTRPDAHWLKQIAIASVRRFFYLAEDWSMTLRSARYPEFSGEIIVPETTDGERFEFDGASIPMPWLVSMLTIGVLRPLGVLLIASLVHDYAFRYGYLKVARADGPPEQVVIKRDVADRLFRDIITVVNGNRVVGHLAWYFVRLGYWTGVKYNGRRGSGRAPVIVLLTFLAALACLGFLIATYSLAEIALSGTALYVSLYLMTLSQLQALNWKTAMAVVLAVLIAYLMAMRLYRWGSAAAASEPLAVSPNSTYAAPATRSVPGSKRP